MNQPKKKNPMLLFVFIAVFVVAVGGVVLGMIKHNSLLEILAVCAAFIILAVFLLVETFLRKAAKKRAELEDDGVDRRFLRHAEPDEEEPLPVFAPSAGRRGFEDDDLELDLDDEELELDLDDEDFVPDTAAPVAAPVQEAAPVEAAPAQEPVPAEAPAADEAPAGGFAGMFARRARREEPDMPADAEPVPAAAAEAAEVAAAAAGAAVIAEAAVEAEPADRPVKRLPFGARERRNRAAQEAEEAKARELAEEAAREQERIAAEEKARADAEAAELAAAKAAAQAAMDGRDVYAAEMPDNAEAYAASPADIPADEVEAFQPVLKLDAPEPVMTASEVVDAAANTAAAVPDAAAVAAAAAVGAAAAGAAAAEAAAPDAPAAVVSPVAAPAGQPLESFYEMDEDDLLYRDCVEVWAADAKPCLLRLMKYIEGIEDKHTAALFGRECEYVNAMIDRIMYFTSLQYIDEMLDIKKYDFKSMVMECLKRFSPFLIEKKLGLLWKGLDLEVETDKRWFIFVLTQIIFNSVEFTPENGKIAITAKQEGDYIDLIVDDSGKGITAEEMPYIFIAGFIGDDSPNVAGRRTGMGLFIARSVMNKMGGDVFAESNPGKSTRVVIRMPAKVKG